MMPIFVYSEGDFHDFTGFFREGHRPCRKKKLSWAVAASTFLLVGGRP